MKSEVASSRTSKRLSTLIPQPTTGRTNASSSPPPSILFAASTSSSASRTASSRRSTPASPPTSVKRLVLPARETGTSPVFISSRMSSSSVSPPVQQWEPQDVLCYGPQQMKVHQDPRSFIAPVFSSSPVSSPTSLQG